MKQDLARMTLDDPSSAADLFREMLNGTPETRAIVRTAIAERPEHALALLQTDNLGLTAKGNADVLDEVLGTIEDASHARKLMHENLSSERLRELLLARGDLPAVASDLAPLEDVLAAILDEVHEDLQKRAESGEDRSNMRLPEHVGLEDDDNDEEDDDDDDPVFLQSPLPLLRLFDWALKLRDRVDYSEFLELKVGHHTVCDLLALAVWEQNGCPDQLESVPGDEFERVGLDHDHGRVLLGGLLEGDEIVRFGAQEIEEARIELSRQHAAVEKAPQLLSPQAAKSKAAEAGHKLGI